MSDKERSAEKMDEVLAGVEPSRRKFLRGLIVGSVYSAPIISSFSMSGLTANPAMAQQSNTDALCEIASWLCS